MHRDITSIYWGGVSEVCTATILSETFFVPVFEQMVLVLASCSFTAVSALGNGTFSRCHNT